MVKPLEVYVCEICGRRHDERSAAHVCEAQGIIDFDVPLELGNIVLCGSQGWWEGDPDWCVIVPGKTYLGHGTMPLIRSRWIVVATSMDEHLRRYVLWTPSSREGTSRVATTSHWHFRTELLGNVTSEELAKYRAAADTLIKNQGLTGHRLRLV